MKKNLWGKVIGSFLGFALAGPAGGIFGFIVGHVHDSRRESEFDQTWASMGAYEEFTGSVEQAVFTMGVIVLGAKMAKADGRVTREEVAAFKRVFKVNPEQEDFVARLFNRARRNADGFEPYAAQLAHVFKTNAVVLEQILSGLFLVAAADSVGLSQAEINFLKRVSAIFGFSDDQFYRIATRVGVRLPEDLKPKEAHEENYEILGVTPKATADEIKSAYRALIREHHPDKLVAQGMPPEFIAMATEKMKRINVAYDAVCKQREIH